MATIIKIGVVIIFVSAVTLYVIQNTKKNQSDNKDDLKKDDSEDTHTKSLSFEEGCKNELVDIARDFGFLYERTFNYLNDNNIDEDAQYIISEWESRLEVNSKICLVSAWKSINEKTFNANSYNAAKNINKPDEIKIKSVLKEWFNLLKELGIKRDERTEIIIEDNNIHHIYHIEGLWKKNDVLIIIQPAWFLNGKFIEKGKGKVKKV